MDASFLDLAEEAERVDAVRGAAARLLAAESSPAHLRARLEDPGTDWQPALWAGVANLGWADLLAAEGHGGGGILAELAGMAEEVGRAAASIPLVPAAVAAWLMGPSPGLTVPAFTEAGRSGAADPTSVARPEGDGFVVTGAKAFVAYGAVADRFVVSARAEDGSDVLVAVRADAPGVSITALRLLDAAPAADLDLVEVAVPAADVLARGAAASVLLAGARARLIVGWVAELVGVAAAVHDAATEYAKHREAFGRPIGAFQAVKHRLVDLRADVEIARALVGRAARAVEDDSPDAAAMVGLAAFWAGERMRAVPEGAIQVFGGIGYTWDHDAHLFLRRAAVLTALLGVAAAHRDVAVEWLAARP